MRFFDLQVIELGLPVMKKILIFLLAMWILSGCGSAKPTTMIMPTIIPETPTTAPSQATPMLAVTPDLSAFAFPASIDPSPKYLFYLHGKVVEDQGIHAVSPDYGEYEFEAILQSLASYGFVVISEQRSKNADGMKYAERVVGQVTELLNAVSQPKTLPLLARQKAAALHWQSLTFLKIKR